MNTAPFLPPTDVDGEPRVVDGNADDTAVVDLGSDEAPSPDVAAAFAVRVRMRFRAPARDDFRLTGTFVPGATGDDVGPPSELTTLTLSDANGAFYVARLDAGSLVARGVRRFTLAAPDAASGIARLTIGPARGAAGYRVRMRARNVSSGGFDGGPLAVRLRLGDDVGVGTSS